MLSQKSHDNFQKYGVVAVNHMNHDVAEVNGSDPPMFPGSFLYEKEPGYQTTVWSNAHYYWLERVKRCGYSTWWWDGRFVWRTEVERGGRWVLRECSWKLGGSHLCRWYWWQERSGCGRCDLRDLRVWWMNRASSYFYSMWPCGTCGCKLIVYIIELVFHNIQITLWTDTGSVCY